MESLNPLSDLNISDLTVKLQKELSKCSSEEDLRIAVELNLRQTLPHLPTPTYEKTIKTSTFKGRMDAVHQGLIIEYKRPKALRGGKKNAEAVSQLCHYLTCLAFGRDIGQLPDATQEELPFERPYTQEEEERLSTHVGLLTDGETFVFVNRVRKTWHTDSRKIDEDTIEKVFLWVRSMNRKDLSPENLIEDFGPGTKLATEIVSLLAKLVASGTHVKANVIYEEWLRIFGIVYGEEQLSRDRRTPEAKVFSETYRLDLGVDFPVLLFAVHTYYALLMKMLATEVIVSQGGIADTFFGSLTRKDLRKQLLELESGDILQRQNIRNAIDQDFFGWYPEAWTQELHTALWNFVQTLSGYDFGTFDMRPDRARDLLKDLYHGLIPEAVRHALGEYYTPDWLADHTIELAGYDGDPHKTFLDPSCGSGTFLIMAIHKARQWITDRPVEWGGKEQKMSVLSLIIKNIVGFDLNPLAVISARTNYLFALGPLLRYRGRGTDFEIPIYLTDSVLLPGRLTEQQNLFAPETVAFPMSVGTFNIPRDVVANRKVPDLMNLLQESIIGKHQKVSFVNSAIEQLDLDPKESVRIALGELFDSMKSLEEQGKNRVWAKLIRNRYASLLFRHYFDFVVGNPPHVNWESLTPEWRKAAEEEYKHYGLFTLKGLESRHGGGKKDIAALFTYAVTDHFLKPQGVLALVVHVSLFKTSGAGEGFRRFQLGTRGEHFAIEEAHDFRSFQPFMTRTGMRIKTRTLTFRAVKGKTTKYPVSYTVWSKREAGLIQGNLTWELAKKRLDSVVMKAAPLRGTSKEGKLSPWLTLPSRELSKCRKLIAPPNYRQNYEAHEGFNTGGLNGAYFLRILERYSNGTMLIENMNDVGKIKCPKVRATIESDLVYSVIRGRSVARWRYETAEHVLIVQDPRTQKGYPEGWLQETHPLAWSYLSKFEKLLRERKAFKKFFDPDNDPFYSMYSISHYTFAPFKVIWMDVSATVKAAVVGCTERSEMPIPEHTLMLLATENEDEAHFVAAVLNSTLFNMVVTGYIVDNHVSTHPFENLVIPKYDRRNPTHQQLSALSRAAHAEMSKGDVGSTVNMEATIDEVVSSIWK